MRIDGVIKLFISPDGRVIAHAADFERSAPGGYTLFEAQAQRCGRMLAGEVIDAFANPVLRSAMDPYDAEKLLGRLMREKGYTTHTIPIGHEPKSDA